MNFGDKAFCLITGGSRGFGRSAAVALAENCKFLDGSCMVILGRNKLGLNETKNLIEKVNQNLTVVVIISDLQDLDNLEHSVSSALDVKTEDFKTAILVNNAGSLGDIQSPVRSTGSIDSMRKYFDLNVTSVFYLTKKFVSTFNSSKKFVINVSSLAAVQEMPYMTFYCSGKAARDMFHKCLACEESEIRVLNYAPGPLNTDMSMDIQLNCGNEASRLFFKEMREKKTIIEPDVSAAKLIRILKEDRYRSGDHVDFYDVE